MSDVPASRRAAGTSEAADEPADEPAGVTLAAPRLVPLRARRRGEVVRLLAAMICRARAAQRAAPPSEARQDGNDSGDDS